MKPLLTLLLVILGGYVALALLVALTADGVIFQPPLPSYRKAERKIPTAVGPRLAAVYLPNPEARFTILFSHGNAEDLGHNEPYLAMLRAAGFAVFAYDYQGYGQSEGRPSVRNLYRDAEAAYAYLTGELGVPPERVLLLGRSLGGAAAVHLAAQHPVGGLVLESSFTSAFAVLPWLPPLPFDHFPNLKLLEQVRTPVLVMHGRRDPVVGFRHGLALYERVRGPKRFLWVEEGGHNDLVFVAGADYFRALHEFAALVEQTQAGTAAAALL